MRKFIIAALVGATGLAAAQQPKSPTTLRTVLLQELRETHNEKAWFVSEKEAVAGLTPEQAAWSDGKNHSVGQLVQHLNYWNSANLASLRKQPARNKLASNDDTFTFDPKQWETVLKEFDTSMADLEQFVQSADEATLAKIAPTIARIAQHNSYHIGEMVTSRKKQGLWNPENGVKYKRVSLGVSAIRSGRKHLANWSSGQAATLAMDLSNIDVVISTMYEVISGPAGQARDWALLRSLYHPEARLMPALSPADNPPHLRVLTIDQFINRVELIFARESFWERETSRQMETFGRIAHVLSGYECLRDPNGTPFTAGKKTMQLYRDDARWWIVSAMWNTDRAE